MLYVKRYTRLIKTFNLYLAFLTVGLVISIVGPSILDLEHLIADTKHISLIYVARYVGYIAGALLGGVLLDLIQYRQAVLSFCSLVAGCSMILVPWSGNFRNLVACMAVNGVSLGALETGSTVICLTLWGKASAPVFQGLHFTFGLGGLISPLIAAPYLEYHAKDEVETTANASTSTTPFSTYSLGGASGENSTAVDSGGGRASSDVTAPSWTTDVARWTSVSGENSTAGVPGLAYPYAIVGGVACLTAVLFLAVAMVSPTEGSEVRDQRRDNGGRGRGFLATAVLLAFLLIFVYCSTEIGFAQMLTTYAVKGSLRMTVKEGSYLTSAFYGAFAAARLASVPLAARLDHLTLIAGDLVAASAAAVLVLSFRSSAGALWAATIAFGAGLGSFYAAAVGWVNAHICITNKVSSVITVAASLGGMVTPSVISLFADDFPDLFVFVVTGSCAACWVVVLATRAFFRRFDGDDRKMRPPTTTDERYVTPATTGI